MQRWPLAHHTAWHSHCVEKQLDSEWIKSSNKEASPVSKVCWGNISEGVLPLALATWGKDGNFKMSWSPTSSRLVGTSSRSWLVAGTPSWSSATQPETFRLNFVKFCIFVSPHDPVPALRLAQGSSHWPLQGGGGAGPQPRPSQTQQTAQSELVVHKKTMDDEEKENVEFIKTKSLENDLRSNHDENLTVHKE